MKVLILAGGSGTRFWPASRRLRPKQLLPLKDGISFFRRTVDRLLPMLEPEDIWVCTGDAIADEVRRQAPEIPAEQVLREPAGRNTAPAIAWTLSSVAIRDREEILVSLHSDHWIDDEDAFRSTLRDAVDHAAATNDMMALGVKPSRAETGYGYMECGEEIDPERGVHEVLRFVEKPDAATAQQLVDSGRFVWNSGIFVFRIATLLDHLRRLEPRLMAGLHEIEERPQDLVRIYGELPAAAIDTAVMERLESMSTVTLDGWSDIGSWSSLSEILEQLDDGNAVFGRAVTIDASDNVLYSESGTIAVLGVEGLAVVQTDDAVLVVPKERSQEVRRLVERLLSDGRDDLL